jgi:predicted lipoprotein
MRKTIRYAAFFILIAIVAYNSVYFKKLDEVKAGATSFNAAKYAAEFWETKLLPATSKAVETDELLSLLKTDKEKAFADHSHALGIGNIKFFLVKGEGIVESVEENQVLVKIESQYDKPELNIATEYIFGNAVRDASGAIDINEFSNSMDFNNVSAEINKIIREKVIPGFRSKVKKGDRVTFSGAIELNKEHMDLKAIEVIPVSMKIVGSI